MKARSSAAEAIDLSWAVAEVADLGWPGSATPATTTALAMRLAASGVRLETRRIAAGDEAGFADPSEPLARRRASGAARFAARAGLAALGGDASAPLPRSPGRYPLWPKGFVGSLAHDDAMAVAVVARSTEIAGVGVDIEPAEPLPSDVADFILQPSERRYAAHEPMLGRAIFSAKEAVYKAINPFDGTPLEYVDIWIDLFARKATLRDGRTLSLDWARSEHWIVVALATAGTLG